jgi:hypothetical protein
VTSREEKVKLAVGQSYRDRVGTDDMSDEQKDHRDRTGLSSNDLKRNQLMARIVAPLLNGYRSFMVLANQNGHGEMISARHLFLQGMPVTRGTHTTIT